MYKLKSDTIAAVSTAAGRSALSVIRMSGAAAFEIMGRVFVQMGRRRFPAPFSVFYGDLVDPATGVVADRVLVSTFLGPKSYTGEDLVEISAHGNPVILSNILRILFKEGVRAAEAGEFTKRAFLNGKMDLLEVEAVSQLLGASNTVQTALALNQLDGLPSRFIADIRARIVKHLVQLEASLNFPEDSIESIDEVLVGRELRKILRDLYGFCENVRNGSLVSAGLKLAIVGKPNSGKSSLLNYMLGRERAIVSDIAGTTRDTIEEGISVSGVPIRLVDTAGIRRSEDKIEGIGIERSFRAIEEAYGVIGVFDGSNELGQEDFELLSELRALEKPVILIINKEDLPQKLDRANFEGFRLLSMSCLKQSGRDELLGAIAELLKESGLQQFEEMVLLGSGQMLSLDRAVLALERAVEGIDSSYYQDMLAIDMEEAVRELGRISGETVDLNTLDLIFEQFCIGK
jgi:tRNA modification GTPase